MQIKGIIFDFDGVLINTHYLQSKATLEVLKEKININNDIIKLIYKTIPTREKFKILYNQKLITKSEINEFYLKKIILFEKMCLTKIRPIKKINQCFNFLKKNKYKIALVTNANNKTTYKILKKMKLVSYFDVIITNNDVKKFKPNPEPYKKAINILKGKPKNFIIFEDSPEGLESAYKSGSNVIKINKISELDLKKIKDTLNYYEN